MTPQERFSLIQQAMQAFNPHYRETIQQVFADLDIQGVDWFYSYLASGLEPEPLTVEILHQMTPYGNRQVQAERLTQTAVNGYLEPIDDDTYRLTDAGRNGVQAFFTAAGEAIGSLAPLPEKKMTRLADLLARIIAATETADPPSQKTHFQVSRVTDPGSKAAAASKIDQYLTDLLRYRDDAHLAAWVDLDVDGRTWDAFTNVWREQANTPTALAEALANRNYTEADYAASLEELAERSWIKKVGDAYQLTENGRKIREDAEETTDRYYFSGWSALNVDETAELDKLLTKLRDRLQEMAADKAATIHKESGAMAGEISNSIFKLTRPVMNPLFEEMGLAERGLAFALIQGGYFDPEPVSVALVRRRSPYSAPTNWNYLFEQLTERGYFSTAGDGDYLFTDDGRAALNRFLNTFRHHLSTIEVDVGLDRLAELLGRVINACLNAPNPPGTWAIGHSLNVAPDEDACSLAKIDQYLDDLNAFRDDAHIAAFVPYDISGHGWELFTLLWREEVKTAVEMVEKMGFRGHDEATYVAALEDLVQRGWVTTVGDAYTLTDTGREIRETAETQTDRYYYLPWLVLNQAEANELRELMTKVNVRLAQLAEAVVVPA